MPTPEDTNCEPTTTPPLAGTRRAVRRALRAGFYLVFTVVWLAVAVVALETFEQGRSFLENRLYKRYFEEQSKKVYRMVPEEELRKSNTQFSPSKNEDVFSPSTVAPAQPVTADKEKAREAYAAQSEENLNVILALQNELLLEFDRSGRLLSTHGDPLFERFLAEEIRAKGDGFIFEGWQPAYVAVRTATAPVTVDCKLPCLELSGITMFYKAMVTPIVSPDGSIQRVQMLLRNVSFQLPPEQLLTNPGLVQPDSPFIIPYFLYKRNWSKPGAIASYNNFGFRDRDVVVPKPAGVVRIVCIGGSTTEEGNSNDKTYPRLLETKLRTWFGTDRVEVINCGIIGLMSDSERMRMPDFLVLQPDLILHYNAINDIYHFDFPIWQKEMSRRLRLMAKSKFLLRHFNRRFLPSDESIIRLLRKTSFRNIKAMNYAVREQGAEMACCSFASPTVSWWELRDRIFLDMNMRNVWNSQALDFGSYRHVLAIYNRLLKETCEGEGIHYVPVAENMRAGMDHFFDVCHVTPVGMELKVNIIGAYVKDYVQRKLAETPPQGQVSDGR